MATKLIDLTGKRFGLLTVIEFDHFEYKGIHKRPYWKCKCDCGTMIIVPSSNLRNGNTKSCGCIKLGKNHQTFIRTGENRNRLYSVWRMAHKRCEDENYEFYRNYGSRGISVCDEWCGIEGFNRFYEWSLLNGYMKGLTLDRIDNNKGYSPDNCQWKSRKYQSNNKRNNLYFTINGETKTLAEWCEFHNVPYGRVEARITKMGWNIEDALFTPRYNSPVSGKKYEAVGKEKVDA